MLAPNVVKLTLFFILEGYNIGRKERAFKEHSAVRHEIFRA
jgi:hypothetical protein